MTFVFSHPIAWLVCDGAGKGCSESSGRWVNMAVSLTVCSRALVRIPYHHTHAHTHMDTEALDLACKPLLIFGLLQHENKVMLNSLSSTHALPCILCCVYSMADVGGPLCAAALWPPVSSGEVQGAAGVPLWSEEVLGRPSLLPAHRGGQAEGEGREVQVVLGLKGKVLTVEVVVVGGYKLKVWDFAKLFGRCVKANNMSGMNVMGTNHSLMTGVIFLFHVSTSMDVWPSLYPVVRALLSPGGCVCCDCICSHQLSTSTSAGLQTCSWYVDWEGNVLVPVYYVCQKVHRKYLFLLSVHMHQLIVALHECVPMYWMCIYHHLHIPPLPPSPPSLPSLPLLPYVASSDAIVSIRHCQHSHGVTPCLPLAS